MATITPKLTISSTTATGNEALGLSINKETNVRAYNMSGISHAIAPVVSGSYQEIVASSSDVKYVYVSHTGKQGDGSTTTQKILSVELGGTDLIRLLPGEFAYFPLKDSTTVKVKQIGSGSETIMVEYACWAQEVAGG
tara:strand:- start:656 stop:1069 length:414 start_codon:yes stop_codon:yes gene_type:complete